MDNPYRLRLMEWADLELVRRWRNQPAVRENMYTRHEIGPDEHRQFFKAALTDPRKKYFICTAYDGTQVGVVIFVDIDTTNLIATWAFYKGIGAPRGAGLWMGLLALDWAFAETVLYKVSGESIEWNERGIRFHQDLGFRIEGIFRSHHVKDGRRYDVTRFGILKPEWQEARQVVWERLSARRTGSTTETE